MLNPAYLEACMARKSDSVSREELIDALATAVRGDLRHAVSVLSLVRPGQIPKESEQLRELMDSQGRERFSVRPSLEMRDLGRAVKEQSHD